jgi:hypothetical protein
MSFLRSPGSKGIFISQPVTQDRMTAEQVRVALSRLRLRPETAGIMLNAPVRTIQRWRKEGAKGPVVRLLELYQSIGPIGPRA